jgi:hypothetical protein
VGINVDDAEFAMSLFGTTIFTSKYPGSDEDSVISVDKEPVLTPEMLAEGCGSVEGPGKSKCEAYNCAANQVPTYQCQYGSNGRCLQVDVECVSLTNFKKTVQDKLKDSLEKLKNRQASDIAAKGLFYYTPVLRNIWSAVKILPADLRNPILDDLLEPASESFVYLWLYGFVKNFYMNLYTARASVNIGPAAKRQAICNKLQKNAEKSLKFFEEKIEETKKAIEARLKVYVDAIKLAEGINMSFREREKIIRNISNRK